MEDENDKRQIAVQKEAKKRLEEAQVTDVDFVADAEAHALLHELQVHQVELVMQNEELIRARTELEKLLRRYADLYEFAPVGYVTVDRHGIVIESNLTAAAILGIPRSELRNMTFRLYVAPEDLAEFGNLCKRTCEVKTRQSSEIKLLRNRREPFYAWLEASIESETEENSANCRIGIIDITPRKLAEDELRTAYGQMEKKVEERTQGLQEANTLLLAEIEDRKRAEEALGDARHEAEIRAAEIESFVAGIPDGILLLDPESNVVFCNEEGIRMLGGRPEAWLKRFGDEIKVFSLDGPPLTVEESVAYRALHGETVKEFRERLVTPWGRDVMLSVSGSPVIDAQGRIIGATIVFHDISRQVEYEQKRERVLQRERHIAEVLQKALIPDLKYDIPGCEVAVRYESALAEAEVGGDFYDVFDVGDGRIGILIGDVAGKGLPAAIRVAAVRHSIRSYAYIDPRPSSVMTLANEALCRDQPGDPGFGMVTALFNIVDTHVGSVYYANGGHEPPSLLTMTGEIHRLEVQGRALGVLEDYEYPEHSRRLQMGDTVVMMTDGIIEARSEDSSLFGFEGVERYLLQNVGKGPQEIAEGLMAAAKAYAGGALRDDAAIVVFSLKDEPIMREEDGRAVRGNRDLEV